MSLLCVFLLQCGRQRQALRHLQDGHRLRFRRTLQPLLVPQRSSAPLQKRLLGPTQRPPECNSGPPCPGPLSEPEPAPQMNYPPPGRLRHQPGWGCLCFTVMCWRDLRTMLIRHKKKNRFSSFTLKFVFFAGGWYLICHTEPDPARNSSPCCLFDFKISTLHPIMKHCTVNPESQPRLYSVRINQVWDKENMFSTGKKRKLYTCFKTIISTR